MSEHEVPVSTWLDAATWRRLYAIAEERDTTVAVLVAIAARKAVTPRPDLEPGGRRHIVTEAHLQAIRDLNAVGLSDAAIGRRIGLPSSTTTLRRKQLGLPRNHTRRWGAQ